MKSSRFQLLGVLFLGITLLTGCKKEDWIKFSLWSGNGKWNIEQFDREYNNSGNEGKTVNLSYTDCGTFKFNKNGSGLLKMTIDGKDVTNAFNYSNSQQELYIRYGAGDIYGSGTEFRYVMDKKGKDMKLTYKGPAIYSNKGWDYYNISLKK